MDGKEQIYQDKDTKDDCDSGFEVSVDSSLSSSSSALDSMRDENSSASSYGPLYELSELMAQLPIKRGLSKHYQGKSQTFTSLSSVNSLEDLVKRVTPGRRNMNSCMSFGARKNNSVYFPKAIITKKKKNNYRLSLLLNPNFRGGAGFSRIL